jgi:hypothetical protein
LGKLGSGNRWAKPISADRVLPVSIFYGALPASQKQQEISRTDRDCRSYRGGNLPRVFAPFGGLVQSIGRDRRVFPWFGEGTLAANLRPLPCVGSDTDQIADLLAFMVSPAAKWMTGTSVRMDGGEVKGV